MVQGWSKNQTVFKRLGFEFYSNSVLPISTDDNTESLNGSEEEISKKVNKKNDVNYFKILIVAIIPFAALILVLDTFKVQISVIIPNIQIILDNLYQSINDRKLFIIDLRCFWRFVGFRKYLNNGFSIKLF